MAPGNDFFASFDNGVVALSKRGPYCIIGVSYVGTWGLRQQQVEVSVETTVLEVTLSKDLYSRLGFSKEEAEEAIKEFSVLGLYLEHKISSGKAAELLGMRRREFLRLMARKGIPYFDYSDQELANEFRAVDEWNRD
jgi:predicted HTH domain antitoxin